MGIRDANFSAMYGLDYSVNNWPTPNANSSHMKDTDGGY